MPSPVVALTLTPLGARPSARARRLAHRVAVRRELRALHHDRAVDVLDREAALARPARRPRAAARSSRRPRSADRCPGSAGRCRRGAAAPEQRVDDRVGEHVGVGVAGEAALVRDLDAAEDQRAAGRERVRVDPRCRSARISRCGSIRRRAALEDADLRDARGLERGDRVLVAVADLLGHVRVAGQRDRQPGVDRHLEQRGATGTARRPACAARRSRPPSRRRRRASPAPPARSSGAGRAPGRAARCPTP